MTSTVSMFAPAGVLGQGSALARPYAGAAVRRSAVAPVVAVQGTGLPTGRFRAQDHVQNDGTTLGFHPSSRLTS